MLFSAHPDALYENLILSHVDPFDNVFAHSRISVTEGLLAEYEQRFSGMTERQLLTSLMSSLGARLKVVKATKFEKMSSLGGNLQAAANYGGKNLVLASGHLLGDSDKAVLESLGIRFGQLPQVFDATCQLGFAPFERFVLSDGDNASPECITRFFRGEQAVTFYDKFINSDAISFINYILPHLAEKCTIMVVTSRQGLSLQTIRAQINPGRQQRVIVEQADVSTTSRFHDRHVFIGKHYQIHIPRGLDLFGSAPNWRNLNGELSVYDCADGRDATISFIGDGKSKRAPLRLKACVIA